MNTFQIQFKLRYGETADHGSELIKAADKNEALQKFAKRKRITVNRFKSHEDWEWSDGAWTAYFKCIASVAVKKCPHCGSTEIIYQ